LKKAGMESEYSRTSHFLFNNISDKEVTGLGIVKIGAIWVILSKFPRMWVGG